jgi:hypothetical protein
VPGAAPAPAEPARRGEIVTIVMRTPAPRPSPTPTPPPRATPPPVTPAPRYTLAPRITRAAPAPRAAAVPRTRAGGAATRRREQVVTPARPDAAAPPVSVADGAAAGERDGGTGTGAGAGNGDGGLAGTGTGTGGTGSGTGGESNLAPCADIFLLPAAVSYRRDGTVVQQVLAKLVERDGTVRVDRFPYPFVYRAERDDPFRHDEDLSTDAGIPVQMPPPGMDVAAMPATVQIVLKYTDPKTGLTSMPACTTPSAPP